jgi:cold shock CspA family protein
VKQFKDVLLDYTIAMSDATDSTPSDINFDANKVYAGRVKWFNNKSGFGFITVLNDESVKDYDMFVHHSSVKVDQEQFRYLLQGEYVQFNVEKVTDKSHAFQACDVSGMFGGQLMCETRNNTRNQKVEYKKSKEA